MVKTTSGRESLEERLWDFVAAYDAAFDRAAAQHGLSGAQACTMTPLLRAGHTMKELATQLHCDASNVTQIIGRLETRGFVRREPDPADARVKRVVITEEGRRAREAMGRAFSFVRDRLEALTAAEREQLGALLTRLTADHA